jgi:DNA-binding transcriptional LysR family regulator
MLPSLDDLSLLVSIADEGGFTAAAKALGLPKSTVSRRLAELEAGLSTSLFRRSTRALSLTDEGQRIYHLAKPAIVAAREAAQAIAAREQAVAGRVTLTATAAVGQFLIAPQLPALTTRYPNLQVELRLTERRINIVSEGVDLAVRMGVLDDSNLVARKLCTVRRHLVAAPEYLAREGIPVHPADLAGHRAILTSGALASWRFADGWECALRWNIAAGNMLVAHQLALAGGGIALLPDFLIESALQGDRLVPVLDDHWNDVADAWLVSSRMRYRSSAVRAVMEALTEASAQPKTVSFDNKGSGMQSIIEG